ncbi:hypothetical protein TSUD_232310 [Trifolium subterraneum]|uniref:RNase H type-1 domain-containing protein n=1 Tax=Trifolium subterraneum TaxID=3900 RepID=A0A2Z6LJA0_TRISU|nr:hypothetical protein TSUD_232310 [Trifolium subterraneum]
MKNILTIYEAASGQSINLQKSELFCSRNIPDSVQNSIVNILGVQQVLGTDKYLGLPSMIGRSRKSTFSFIKDRIWKKINSWSSKCLSQAGREVLIKSVLQTIHSYIMSIFLIPSSVIDDIEKMLNSFWWGHNRAQSKGIRWMSWERLSVHKQDGGMGFKSLGAFNHAMLGKQAWNLITKPDTLVAKLFKAKYFPHSDFLESSIGHNPSYVWRSIWSSKFVVKGLIRGLVNDDIADKILHTPLLESVQNDKITWQHEKNGLYTVKSDEDNNHLFFSCQNSINCWQQVGLWSSIMQHRNLTISVKENVFNIMLQLNEDNRAVLVCVMWSIWKQRNDVIWQNERVHRTVVCERANSLLTGWRNAREVRDRYNNQQHSPQRFEWTRPDAGTWKCNVGASFSRSRNKVGIGVCIRDDQGQFVLAKTEWYSPILDVDTGEALGLLSALKWVKDLHLNSVLFELDSKRVVDKFNNNMIDESVFGDIIKDCKHVFNSYFTNSHVEFIRRQVNGVAHNLAKVAPSLANFRIHTDIPTCIQDLIINEML